MIIHSERSHEDDRAKERTLHGLQFWIALPDGGEEVEPSFQHYTKPQIPRIENNDYDLSLVAGDYLGTSSPVRVSSPLMLAHLKGKNTSTFRFEVSDFELAVYVVGGIIKIQSTELHTRQMVITQKHSEIEIQFEAGAEFIPAPD